MAHKRAGYTEEKHQQGGGGYGAKYDERRTCVAAVARSLRSQKNAKSALPDPLAACKASSTRPCAVCLRRIEKGKTERPDARNVDGDKRDEKDGALGQGA